MHFQEFVLRIIFAKRQLSIFIIMLSSAFLVLLFFLFFKTFTSYYIQELKLIYPSFYLVKDKSLETYKLKNFDIASEIFELNSDNFSVSFDAKEYFTLGSVGIRSFSKEHIPKLLTKVSKPDSLTLEKTIYLSSHIYKQLKSSPLFHDILYIKSDKDSSTYKFHVKEFTLHDNTKWVLFANSAAHKIYRESFFNKVSFYPHNKQLSDKEVTNILTTHFKNIIYRWDEHISLVSRALKESMLYLFSWTAIAIAILSTMSILFFTRELVDDLTHLTQHAFFYTISFNTVYISYLIITNAILITLLLITYLLAFYVNTLLSHILWSVDSYHNINFVLSIALALFVLTAAGLYSKLNSLYCSQKGLAHA